MHVCQELKSPYKEIALEHFYKEKTAAQIAAEQGKNLKTVQTQIYRAKAMIRKKLQKKAPGHNREKKGGIGS